MRTPQPINVTQRATLLKAVQPKQTGSKAPFYIVLLYLLLEFGRPQDIISGLGALSLPMLTIFAIGLLLVFSGSVNFSNMQTKLFLALLALMVVHGPIAVNNFHALMTFKATALNFICFLGIVTFVDSVRKIQTLANVWLAVHVYLAFIGIIKGGVGIGGFLGDENDFCMELNMVLSFAFFGFFSASNKSKKSTYLGLLCIYLLTIMTTLSRGGFIGMSAVGAYCWAQSSRKILSTVLVFLLVGFMLLAAPETYWNEIESTGSEETMEAGTGGERLYTWGIAWEMFLANPIIGVGQGNFPWVFDQYESGRNFQGKSIAGRAAHSLYFTLLPELGLVGVCIFVGMLYFTRKDLGLIYQSYNAKVEMEPQGNEELKKAFFLAHAMEGSLVGYLVSSIFITTLYYPSFWVMMGFVVALRNLIVGNRVNLVKSASVPIRNLSSRSGSASRAGAPPNR